jgi:putative FmdB family regulatory protein
VPTYQYACTACGEELEAVQKFSDPSLTECPSCSGALRKVFSAVGVVFKGSGFYKTDSRSSAVASDKASDKGSEKGSEKASDKGSDKGSGKASDKKADSASAPAAKSDSTKSSKPAATASSSSTPAS